MGTETQRQALRCFGRLAALISTATIGVALTGAFCQGYLWKAQDPSRGVRHLFWEPESLVAITVLEFAVLGTFFIRAATRAHAIGALGWVIFLLFVFNIVLTVALLGVPAAF